MMKIFAILTLAVWCGLSANAKADDSVGIEGSPEALFKKLDSNGDGKLTASEIPKEQARFFERTAADRGHQQGRGAEPGRVRRCDAES